MDYLLTLGAKWPHSIGYVGKYSHHGAFGIDTKYKYILLGIQPPAENGTEI